MSYYYLLEFFENSQVLPLSTAISSAVFPSEFLISVVAPLFKRSSTTRSKSEMKYNQNYNSFSGLIVYLPN